MPRRAERFSVPRVVWTNARAIRCQAKWTSDKAPWNNRVREDLFCLLNLFRNCFALTPTEGKSSPRSAGRFCPISFESPNVASPVSRSSTKPWNAKGRRKGHPTVGPISTIEGRLD